MKIFQCPRKQDSKCILGKWSDHNTAVADTVSGTFTFDIIYNYLQHNEIVVHVFNGKYWKKPAKSWNRWFFDGAAKLTLYDKTWGMEDYGVILNLHFFKKPIGKGAVDDVGSMLNIQIWLNKANINDTASYFNS